MTPLPTPPDPSAPDWTTPRPIDASYWVVPGRLLAGEYPGSRSRAQSMERLRSFLEAGITCFVDLTEPDELPGYEMLLPFETPTGRRVEYLREPIVDHGVPTDRETMARIVATIDGALDTGHRVYVHCRAGVGRSAMAVACWLAERNAAGGEGALLELADYWQQAAQSSLFRRVPETSEQSEYVRTWAAARTSTNARPAASASRSVSVAAAPAAAAAASLPLAPRIHGAWLGLALGDALGSAPAGAQEAGALAWSQHTSLALALAQSLDSTGRNDARDQMERYWRWFKHGECAADGTPGEAIATADVARAIATYRWRGLPRAGSHDPADNSPTSLARAVAAVTHLLADPVGAIALGAEVARTTHQSPVILDACRLYVATLASLLRGQSAEAALHGVPEPVAGCWGGRPLRKDVVAAANSRTVAKAANPLDVLQAVRLARAIVDKSTDFDDAIARVRKATREPSLLAALVGTLHGALHGPDALPAPKVARLAGRALVDAVAARCVARQASVAPGPTA